MQTSNKLFHISKVEKAELIKDLHSAYRLYRVEQNKKPYDLLTPNDKNSIYYSALKDAIAETIGRVEVREATLHLFFHSDSKINYKVKTIHALKEFIEYYKDKDSNLKIEDTSRNENLLDIDYEKIIEELSIKIGNKEFFDAENIFSSTCNLLELNYKHKEKALFISKYSKLYSDLETKSQLLIGALESAEKTNEIELINNLKIDLATNLYSKGNVEKALELLEMVIDYKNILFNSREVIRALVYKSFFLLSENKREAEAHSSINNAIVYISEILKDRTQSNRENNYYSLSFLFSYLRNLNVRANEIESAEINCIKMLKYAKLSQSKLHIAEFLTSIAKFHFQHKKNEKWKDYLNIALNIFMTEKLYENAYNSIISICRFSKESSSDKTIYEYFKFYIISLLRSINENEKRIFYTNKIAIQYLFYGDIDETIFLMEDAYQYALESKSKELYIPIYINLLKINDIYDFSFKEESTRNRLVNEIKKEIKNMPDNKTKAKFYVYLSEIYFYYEKNSYEFYLNKAEEIYLKESNFDEWADVVEIYISNLIELGKYAYALEKCNLLLKHFENNKGSVSRSV